MTPWLRIYVFLFYGSTLWAASSPTISDAEAAKSPTPQRIETIMTAAQREGWAVQAAPLRAAAHAAYRQNKVAPADAWFNLYRWTTLWGMIDSQYLAQWSAAVKAAQLPYPNMPNFAMRRLPLGLLVLPELQRWLLNNNAFSQDFFFHLSAVDYLPGVFQILNELHFSDPARFQTYANLALAIALVYDVPPPPAWPHGQVVPGAFERKLPKPREAFTWWTNQDQLKRTYHSLARLEFDELKFVVDTAAPLTELEWAQQVVDYPLAVLGRAYTMVRYDLDRVQRNDLIWTGDSYRLDDILAAGGICVDQGYFAAQVGKAHGVPTLLFRGEGTNSRHAWFGFLDGKGKWQLDVGRYAEQRYVTGYTTDPQTWRQISDHELRFLSDRFLTQPAYLQSRIHAEFASDFLVMRDPTAAMAAARKALQVEKRNVPAWEVLTNAEKQLNRDPLEREATLRQAALAFHAYPDLEAAYTNRATESMRARGEGNAADLEQSRLAQKNQENRGDINLRTAGNSLVQSFSTRSLPEQIELYNTLVATQGKGGGIAFFDQIVLLFVEHLLQLQQPAEATKAVEMARQALKGDSNTQLAREIEKLSQRIKNGV